MHVACGRWLFLLCEFWDWAQAIRLGSKNLYPLETSHQPLQLDISSNKFNTQEASKVKFIWGFNIYGVLKCDFMRAERLNISKLFPRYRLKKACALSFILPAYSHWQDYIHIYSLLSGMLSTDPRKDLVQGSGSALGLGKTASLCSSGWGVFPVSISWVQALEVCITIHNSKCSPFNSFL